MSTEDPKQIIKDHARLLYTWLFGSWKLLNQDKKAVKSLKKAMSSISRFKDAHIYRGLKLPTKDALKMLNGKPVGLINWGLESWSVDPNVAMEFSLGTSGRKDYVSFLVSRKRPKKGTIIVDFNATEVQETMREYIKSDFDRDWATLENMKREQELVTMPQCDKCRLSDVEIIWVNRISGDNVIKKLNIDPNQLDHKLRIVYIKGKNKYELAPKNVHSWNMNLKRKFDENSDLSM